MKITPAIQEIIGTLTRSQLLRNAVFLLSLAHIAGQLGYWLPIRLYHAYAELDATIYYRAAVAAWHHRPLYTFVSHYGPDQFPRNYIYPPVFAACLSPFALVSYATFVRIWYFVVVAGFWAYAYALAQLSSTTVNRSAPRTLATRITARAVLGWGLLLGLMPGVYYTMGVAQVDPILWAIFGLSLSLSLRAARLDWTRGALFALLAQVKIYTIWALALAVVREPRKTIVPAAVAVVAGMLLSIGVCGFGSIAAWIKIAAPEVSQGTFLDANWSLSFAVLRLARLLGWSYTGGPLPAWAHAYLTVMAVLAPVIALLCTRRMRSESAYAVITLAAVVFSPLCWEPYYALALTPIALAVGRMNRSTDAVREAGLEVIEKYRRALEILAGKTPENENE
jgi:hypothetical protein